MPPSRPGRVSKNLIGKWAKRAKCAPGVLALGVLVAWPQSTDAAPRAPSTPARTEVQIGLCAPFGAIAHALDARPRGDPIEAWLFDDAGLALFTRGLRVRLRVSKARSDLTLKVADQDCGKIAPELLPPGEAKCEFDLHGATTAGAVSLTHAITASATRDLVGGKLPVTDALSAAQKRYLREVVRAWPLPSDLRALGPQKVMSYRASGKPYDIDVSELPTGERYVEISRKVPPADAHRVQASMESDLARADIAICADQSAQALNKLRALLRAP
jgi:hypothetical protein